jgi:hypothetical protein
LGKGEFYNEPPYGNDDHGKPGAGYLKKNDPVETPMNGSSHPKHEN